MLKSYYETTSQNWVAIVYYFFASIGAHRHSGNHVDWWVPMRLLVGVAKNSATSTHYTLVYSVWEDVSNKSWASMNEFTHRDDPLVRINCKPFICPHILYSNIGILYHNENISWQYLSLSLTHTYIWENTLKFEDHLKSI